MDKLSPARPGSDMSSAVNFNAPLVKSMSSPASYPAYAEVALKAFNVSLSDWANTNSGRTEAIIVAMKNTNKYCLFIQNS
ncbi:hypothetical protein HZA73_05815 [candidate division TA06 bacterium]|nr:hypothetical protein [candidate division TA06 bacterium]